MSKFYGVLQGSRGQATRCGTKGSGITATAASWAGAIETTIHWNEKLERNEYTVTKRAWHGHGDYEVLAEGSF
jgi:hypothetical protein